jgi:hypothetical protein
LQYLGNFCCAKFILFYFRVVLLGYEESTNSVIVFLNRDGQVEEHNLDELVAQNLSPADILHRALIKSAKVISRSGVAPRQVQKTAATKEAQEAERALLDQILAAIQNGQGANPQQQVAPPAQQPVSPAAAASSSSSAAAGGSALAVAAQAVPPAQQPVAQPAASSSAISLEQSCPAIVPPWS